MNKNYLVLYMFYFYCGYETINLNADDETNKNDIK